MNIVHALFENHEDMCKNRFLEVLLLSQKENACVVLLEIDKFSLIGSYHFCTTTSNI